MSESLTPRGSPATAQLDLLERGDKSLEHLILRDLFASYKFSQGHGPSHDEFFRGLRVTYEMRLGEAGYGLLQKKLNHLDRTNATRLRIPIHHVRATLLKGQQADFGNQLSSFLRILDGAPVDDRMHLFRSIGAHTIKRDIKYQESNRMHTPDDVHKSYFRDYILGLDPTGNESFDYLFGLVSAAFDPEWLATSGVVDLNELIDKWHEAHPHESFIAA